MFVQSEAAEKRIERLVGPSYQLNLVDDEFMEKLQKNLMASYRDKLKENVYTRMGKQAARDRFLDACGYNMTEMDTRDEEMTSKRNKIKRIKKVFPSYYSRDFKELTVEAELRPYVEPEELKLLEARELKFQEIIAKVLSERMSIYVRYKIPAIKYMDDSKTVDELYQMSDAIIWKRDIPEEWIPGASQPKRQCIIMEPGYFESIVEQALAESLPVIQKAPSEASSIPSSEEEKEEEEEEKPEAIITVQSEKKETPMSVEPEPKVTVSVRDIISTEPTVELEEEEQFDEIAEIEDVEFEIAEDVETPSLYSIEGAEISDSLETDELSSLDIQEAEDTLKETPTKEVLDLITEETMPEVEPSSETIPTSTESLVSESREDAIVPEDEAQGYMAVTPISPKQDEDHAYEGEIDEAEDFQMIKPKEDQTQQSDQPEKLIEVEEELSKQEIIHPSRKYSEDLEQPVEDQSAEQIPKNEMAKEETTEEVLILEQSTELIPKEEIITEQDVSQEFERNIDVSKKEAKIEEDIEQSSEYKPEEKDIHKEKMLEKDETETALEKNVVDDYENEEELEEKIKKEDSQDLSNIQQHKEGDEERIAVDMEESKGVLQPTSEIETAASQKEDIQHVDLQDDLTSAEDNIEEELEQNEYKTEQQSPHEASSTEIDTSEHSPNKSSEQEEQAEEPSEEAKESDDAFNID